MLTIQKFELIYRLLTIVNNEGYDIFEIYVCINSVEICVN